MSLLAITCPNCGFSKNIERERIPDGMSSIKCPKCQQAFALDLEGEADTFKIEFEASSSPAPAAAHPLRKSSAAPSGPFKFCASCGQQILEKAEICPACGVRAKSANGLSKVALLLITFFLGGMGGHKFYLKKYGQGILYFLFFWTYIPALAALIEFIIYCTRSEDELQRQYPEVSSGVLVFVAAGFFGIALLGILAAIAIPQFAAYRDRAYNVAARRDLQNCRLQAEAYFAENISYPTEASQLQCATANNVALYYLAIGPQAYQLISFHDQGKKAFLQDSDSLEMAENSKAEIEQQLKVNIGADALERTFHFVE
jgi:TM2 domain-containing membrane protein YozV